jgi:hypothetical protein
MLKFKKIIIDLLLVTLPSLFILFIILELCFRFVIPAAEKPIAYFDKKNAILRSDENRRTEGTYTIGKFAQIRANWRTNNYGWNSSIDYYPNATRDKKLICIIGDSYVRALQVDVSKNIASLLRNNMSKNYDIYSFGHDGAPLSQYLHMSRYVGKQFNPDILIFLLVHNDFHESIAQLVSKPYFLQVDFRNGGIFEIEPKKPKLYQFLTYSALFRYLYSNLNLASIYFNRIQKPNKYNANIEVKTVMENETMIEKATDYLIKKIKDENRGKRLIFMMDAPRNDIYNNQLLNSSIVCMNKMVARICKKNDLEYIDLTNIMHKDYMKYKKEFNSKLDGHWNEYGHYIASDTLYSHLTTQSAYIRNNSINAGE